MIKFTLGEPSKLPRRVLCLGSHCDDIEIGCGGTILRLLEADPSCEVHWVVFSSTPKRRKEAQLGAALFLKAAKSKKVVIHRYRDGFFPYLGSHIKLEFEKLKKEFSPDLVLTHCRHDLHQDHRLICELTWNTFRNHFILEYEIAKYDADLGSPNFFVDLSESHCRRKLDYIFRAFTSQKEKQWFTEDTFRALLRLRGVESNAPGKYAEAFYCRKLLF